MLSNFGAYMEMMPNDCKVILKSKKFKVPEVLSTLFRAHVITFLAFSPEGLKLENSCSSDAMPYAQTTL